MLKNKPLMIGVMAVIALLIAGGIYFFVIRDSDSATDADTDTSTDGSEEAGTEPGTGTEDDSAVLVAKGFDCQTITVAAEAQAQVAEAQAAEGEDAGYLAFVQLQASLLGESEIADSEILDCNHAEKHIDVIVAPSDDADVYMNIAVQAVCTVSESQNISPEVAVQGFMAGFVEDPAFMVGSNVYFATSSASVPEPQTLSAQKQLGALLEEAEAVEYTSYVLPDGLACA